MRLTSSSFPDGGAIPSGLALAKMHPSDHVELTDNRSPQLAWSELPFGYDGPCPPWNDSLTHHYHFTMYALDLERCPVDGSFDAAAVLAAIEGHVLGQATVMGTYTLNPEL